MPSSGWVCCKNCGAVLGQLNTSLSLNLFQRGASGGDATGPSTAQFGDLAEVESSVKCYGGAKFLPMGCSWESAPKGSAICSFSPPSPRNYGWFATHSKFKGSALSLGRRISARNGGFGVSCQLSRVSMDALSMVMPSCLHICSGWLCGKLPPSQKQSQCSWSLTAPR